MSELLAHLYRVATFISLTDPVTDFFSFLGRTTVAIVQAPVQIVKCTVEAVAETVAALTTSTVTCQESTSHVYRGPVLVQPEQYRINLLVVVASFPSGDAPDGGKGNDDLIALFSIFVSAGCLVATGPVLTVFVFTGFALTGYTLTVKTAKMVQRVLDGENVLEPNSKNLIEWLELASTAAGFSSTFISKLVVPQLRAGNAKDVLMFLADTLKTQGMHGKTLSIGAKLMTDEYHKKLRGMNQRQQNIELAATTLHFMKICKHYGLWN